jgi:hypothetical protein
MSGSHNFMLKFLAQKQHLPAQNTRMYIILKWNASTRWSLSIFTSHFHIHFSCTLYSGSFTLMCKIWCRETNKLFCARKIKFDVTFFKATCSSRKFNFDWHMPQAIHSFTVMRPEYCISQFKYIFLRDLAGFVFLRAFNIYYRILECFFVQTSSSFSTIRRSCFLHVQEISRSALPTFIRNTTRRSLSEKSDRHNRP